MGKIYAEVLEESALEQFNSAMKQPFVVDGALMPDAHTGYSLPIGAVVKTDNYIVPSWVGYDIGCGMCALKLDGIKKFAIKNNAKEIFDGIYNMIPVGFNTNKDPIENYSIDFLTDIGKEIAEKKRYKHALGSLGGGNHFIEIGYSEDDTVWVIIHSGSRGVGHGIATHYMKLAHPEGKAKDGHYGFVADSKNGIDYIKDMSWCLDYALKNRLEMMKRVVAVISKVTDNDFYNINYSNMINKNHNHAIRAENNTWIHRKGATQAGIGMLGVIPGNMSDGSFIITGKGNPDSLNSSSHGAGRVLSRRKAKETLNVHEFEDVMWNITAKVDKTTLDESPFAYKNIFDVMDLQKDLVKVNHHIKPLINIKGVSKNEKSNW